VCNTVVLSSVEPYNYNGTVRSGYLRVGKGNSVLGFIFYGRENTNPADLSKHPVIIWLNGWPGTSSQLGNLMELGPFFVKLDMHNPYTIARNPNAWTKLYSVLFVDQPVGSGLSYADPDYPKVYPTSMEEVADDFYAALRELYLNNNGCFNQLSIKPNQDLIIFGENYAGKYVPAIAIKIRREQQDHGGFLTGLRGIAIGDPFTQPFDIMTEIGEYAYNLGLIDYQER
jgi:carboxypeptidase C (cathepsin A)